MTSLGDDSLRSYYETVLAMLERVAREQRGRKNPSIRTSDVVQEIYLRLAPQLRRRESVESLVPLAATVARHWLIDRARKHVTPHLPHELLEGAARSLRRDGIEPLDLEIFLDSLPDRGRAVVDLRIFAGLDQKEIIHITGETEYFVKTTLKQAKRELVRLDTER